jgi:hypothetical protein
MIDQAATPAQLALTALLSSCRAFAATILTGMAISSGKRVGTGSHIDIWQDSQILASRVGVGGTAHWTVLVKPGSCPGRSAKTGRLTLAILSPLIAEVLRGATKFSVIFALVPEILVWGCGALVIREVVRRWPRRLDEHAAAWAGSLDRRRIRHPADLTCASSLSGCPHPLRASVGGATGSTSFSCLATKACGSF